MSEYYDGKKGKDKEIDKLIEIFDSYCHAREFHTANSGFRDTFITLTKRQIRQILWEQKLKRLLLYFCD